MCKLAKDREGPIEEISVCCHCTAMNWSDVNECFNCGRETCEIN